MVKCSHSWQFESIAAMKFALSLTSTLIGFVPSPFWALVYLPGVIAGTAGNMSLVGSNFTHSMVTITAVFGSLAITCAVLSVIVALMLWHGKDPCASGILIGLIGYLSFIPFVLVFGALYSDWVLAIVGNNLVGYPYTGSKIAKVLWVLYMVGKRLNLFMA
ncbi:hypothetical protein N7466_010556 [Penicillium verhagenii]|uniref:uncharacterized protein n=1 Tax=Penicillium verhagenii TaxID=1562060 RepID=UPI0025459E98|nr:uncharacterized protein N7466_010556 [Penicillium verhagenii]KAJ5918564.1 hypothetical protein N7466_010556 [Penicillium verhagenii]